MRYVCCMLFILLMEGGMARAQELRFDAGQLKTENGFLTIPELPDGDYRVTVIIGSPTEEGVTTLRGESRRLFFENVPTQKGEFKELTFTINKRNTLISPGVAVRIKPREVTKLNWDDSLTFEFTGEKPQVQSLAISRVRNAVTIFLCGDSTVVDQDDDPWASWGQMIPRFFTEAVSIANYAESGESANSFIGEQRLAKILTQIKPGDYIFVEFGHNDQKQKGEGKGAYLHYYDSLKEIITAAREKGARPVLVTPTQRRSFNEAGKIVDTHEDYPDAMRKLAQDEQVPLIDLHAMTRTLYEAMGPEPSKRAFVHYPANTFPGQEKALADDTHFNPYGAYQIAKCVIEGMKAAGLPLVQYLREDYLPYDPARPDPIESFIWTNSQKVDLVKPDGN